MTLPRYETLALALDGAVAVVTLNRPDKANAMNMAMWRELQAVFNWLDAEPAVRAVVLKAAGKHFSAGIDLDIFAGFAQQMQGMESARRSEALRQQILQMQANLTAIEACRKPVLAAVQRVCFGGALAMVACCDMRYCTEDAQFSIKEVDIGMMADVGTLQRLPGLIGEGMVREMAYTGRSVAGDEALRLSLVNQVFADQDAMMQQVMALAQQIASKSPLAIRGTKTALLHARDNSVQAGLEHVATWNAGMLSQHDVMLAIAANAEGKSALFDD